jgi:hypothetical protein
VLNPLVVEQMTIEDGNVSELSESSQDPGSLALGVVNLIAVVLVFGFFVVGVQGTFFPSEHSRIFSWLSLLMSTGVIVFTVPRWVKYLPVFFGAGVLNSLILAFSGHYTSSPLTPVSRVVSLTMTVACGLGAFLSASFRDRKLYLLDRLAALAVVFGFAYGAAHDAGKPKLTSVIAWYESVSTLSVFAGIVMLFLAWAYNKYLARLIDGPEG